MKHFAAYSHYYDLLYKDKDYEGEVDYLKRLIQKFAPTARSILNLGCGTGRHDILLADGGYQVHGVDLSKTMLEEAQKRVELSVSAKPFVTFSCGDVRSIRLGKEFDLVISLFHVVSYQVTNADLVATFQTVKAHLKKGGAFIFDCWYGPTVLTERPTVRVKRLEDATVRVTRIAEPVIHPNDNTVDVNYHVLVLDKQSNQLQEIKEVHRMRYLFKPEIEKLLAEAALRLIHCEEWLTSKDPGFDTFGVCFIGGNG